ncbi:MAG: gamma-glutamyltransferase [Gemmatimonadota bacterium]
MPSSRLLLRFPLALALALALLLGACATQPVVEPAAPAVSLTDPTAQVARSPHGMVASASSYATQVGAAVLAQGGNAVDAAVATAFTLAVTEPPMSGLGGRASTVIRTPDGQVYGIDGLNQVPQGYAEGAPAGYDRAAIPGVPAALGHALERYGSWPLARLLAPAILLAEEGFILNAEVAGFIAGAADDLRQHEGSRRYFLKPDGSPYQEGDRLVQRDLARTLRGIAEGGVAAFYGGWIADSIHADMVRRGGFITRAELADYEALPAILVEGSYRGFELVSNYQPASGHTVIEALHIMEHFDLGSAGAAERASLTGQAMQLALSDRSRRFGTPEESAARLTSRAHAAERAREIRGPEVGQPVPAGAAEQDEPWWLRPDADHTTHLSVIDADGMAVTHTQSLGPAMGTALAAPGLGFLYATRLGSVPGSRPGSTISPTLVTDPAGRLRYALGGAGDARIITAVIQTLSGVIDRGLSIEEAVAAPRVHPGGQASLNVEQGERIRWTDADVARLRELGFEVEVSTSGYFGRVHAVAVDGSTLEGAADPRRSGTAVGVRR